MVNMLRRFHPFLDLVLNRVVVIFRVHQHGCHAERVGAFQIMRHVLEHGRFMRGDIVRLEKFVIGGTVRLGHEAGIADIEYTENDESKALEYVHSGLERSTLKADLLLSAGGLEGDVEVLKEAALTAAEEGNWRTWSRALVTLSRL